MACKDCIHYEPCRDTYYNDEEQTRIPFGFFEQGGIDKACAFFKDKSKFIELPCKVGDILYVPTRNFISEYRIDYFHLGKYGICYSTSVIEGISTRLFTDSIENIGKTVFLTKEEAEQALRERNNGK